MTDPVRPNYNKDVGRLATDRYDFEKHLNGTAFRHTAGQIDLSPHIVIDSVEQVNVQDAIAKLNSIISSVPDATTGSKGIVQLAGDIAGIATSVSVIRLRGYPINSTPPTVTGHVLTWGGASWGPAAAIGYVAGGDLRGDATTQYVHSLTGADITGIITILGNSLTYSSTSSSPTITQLSTGTGAGQTLNIKAQTTTDPGMDGGTIAITSGGTVSGLPGIIFLAVDDYNKPLFQMGQITSGNNVISLFNDMLTTSAKMPAGTGDKVLYVSNAGTIPTANPVDGAILYSASGTLNVRQADGKYFQIAPGLTDIVSWGDISTTGGIVNIYKEFGAVTIAGTPLTYNYALEDNTCAEIDVLFMSKQDAADGYSFIQEIKLGAYRTGGGAVTIFGSATPTLDIRTGSTWSAMPYISNSGSNIVIVTGNNTGDSTKWFTITKITKCKSS
jgi:hypothetical protein